MIQKYANNTIGFGFGTDTEEVLPVCLTMAGAGYDERGVRELVCIGNGKVRFVEEVTEHVDNGYCTADTWRGVFHN